VPELPEVETVVRDLREILVDRRIVRVVRNTDVDLRLPWDDQWTDALQNRQILSLRRRGKWILVGLDQQHTLLVHLGMTGQFTVVPAGLELASHTHLLFHLDGPEHLRYRDTRRFGSIRYIADDKLPEFFQDHGVGPEPFDIDAKTWAKSLLGTSRAIKAVIMDQAMIAGVGNIYADEALFLARLHPQLRACDLESHHAEALLEAIVTVLTHAIELRGSSIRDYIGGSGLQGGYQDEFRVYGRTGEACPSCQTAIEQMRIGGRSAHFCPKCQPEELAE
jgi:formamidopyrimidine-DNA glycosylase